MSVNTMETGWGQCIDAPVDRTARTGSSLRTPAARDGALCVFRTDTNQLFVHGGRETVTRGQTFTHSTMLSTTVDPLCPELAWSPVSAPNEGPARYGHAGTIFAPSGTVLIHGGKDSDGNVRPDVFLFKPFVRHDGDESDDDDHQRYGSPNSAQGSSVGRNGRRHSKSTGGGSRSQSRHSASSRRSQSGGRGRSASSSVVSIPCPQCGAQNQNQNQNQHQEDGVGAGENGATDPAQGRAASRASCLSCGTGLAANFTPLDVDTSLTAACADLYPSTKVGQWYRWDKFMCGVAGPMMYGHALYASHRSPAVVVVGPISGDRPSAAPANRRAPKRGRTANDSSSAVAASNGTVMNSVGHTTGVKVNGAPLMKIFTIDLASDEYEWASVDTNNDPAAPTRRGFGLSECPYRPNSFYLVGGEVGRKMERLSDVWLHDGTVGWWREICSSIPMPGLSAAVHPGWGVPKIAAATSATQSNAVRTHANGHDDDGAATDEHGGGATATMQEDDVPPHEKVYEHLPLLVVTARGAGGVIDEIDTDPSTAGALRYDSSGLPTFSNVNAMSQSQSQSQSQYRSSVGVTATTSGTAGAAGSMRGGPSLSAPYSRDRVLPGVLRPTAAGSADGFRATLTADAAPTGHVVAPFAKCYKSVVQNVFLSEIREVVAPTTPQNEVARDGASGGQIDANGEGSAAKEDGDESSNSNPAATTAADQIGAGDTAAPTLKTIGNADAEGRSTDAALGAPEASAPAPGSQDRSFVCDLVAVAKNGAVLFTTLSLDSVDVRKHSTSVHRTAVSNGMTLRLSTPIAHIVQNTNTHTTTAAAANNKTSGQQRHGQQYNAHSANATGMATGMAGTVISTQGSLSAAGATPMIGTVATTAVAVGGPSESISASTALRVGSPSQSLPPVGAFASAEPRPPAAAMSAVVVGHQSSSASPALNVTSAAVPSAVLSAVPVDDASVARPSVSAIVAPSQFMASQGRVSALATQSEVLVAADDEIDVGSILF